MDIDFRDMTRQFLQGSAAEEDTGEAVLLNEATPKQMTLNQSGIDAVRNMAAQVEPMFFQLRKTAGQTQVSHDPLYDQLEEILLELPFQLEKIAEKMEKIDPVQGGIK